MFEKRSNEEKETLAALLRETCAHEKAVETLQCSIAVTRIQVYKAMYSQSL